MNEQLTIFGEEETRPTVKRIGKNDYFNDYESFVDKFEVKKTTDDCYTPREVYDVVKAYAGELADLTDRPVVRPFFPGGDYRNFTYPEDCVVIDNPPFSIITQIVRFYLAAKIDFFLFAPHLTLFTPGAECCCIVAGADIRYENGAIVKTSFLTNLVPDIRVWVNPELAERIEAVQAVEKRTVEKKEYPMHLISSALLGKILAQGIDFKIPASECYFVRTLDAMKDADKTVFGGGFLISERAAKEREAKEQAAKERAAREASKGRVINLSDREKRIVEKLTPTPITNRTTNPITNRTDNPIDNRVPTPSGGL